MLQVKLSLVDDKNNDISVPETQGPECGCVPVTIVEQTIPRPNGTNNKHFIFYNKFVG